MCALRAAEWARSVSWPDDIKGGLNQTLVSSGLVSLILVVFINCCSRFRVVTSL